MTGEDSETIETLLGYPVAPSYRLRKGDRTRLQAALTTAESNFAELEEFVDGHLREDAYFMVAGSSDRAVQTNTIEVYRLAHNYLAGVYSFNEAVRATISRYLPDDKTLSKQHFHPDNHTGVEYTRKLMFIRGLRTAAQHGAFSDVLPVRQWDRSEPAYRLEFDESAFCESETINGAGEYLTHTSEHRRSRPLEYIGSFHETCLNQFYSDCLSWLNQE